MVYAYVLTSVVIAIIYVITGRLNPCTRILISAFAFITLSTILTFTIVQIEDYPLEGARIVDPNASTKDQ